METPSDKSCFYFGSTWDRRHGLWLAGQVLYHQVMPPPQGSYLSRRDSFFNNENQTHGILSKHLVSELL